MDVINSEAAGVANKTGYEPNHTDFQWSFRYGDLIPVFILLVLTLCIGLYRICTTAVIAKDGITFIEYAKGLSQSPLDTLRDQDQHPGYPLLVLVGHQITRLTGDGESIQSWIYSAQGAALLSRVFAVIAAYYLAKIMVGARAGFYAVLILIFLPKPADYGSDALSDWPHFFFLSAGFLLLIVAAKDNQPLRFGVSGLIAGIGYLVRPECIQLTVYGFLWLVSRLLLAKPGRYRRLAMSSLMLLLIGFLIPAGPYMALKRAVFPKQHVLELVPRAALYESHQSQKEIYTNEISTAGFMPRDVAKGLWTITESGGKMLMWFFVPFWVMGLYHYFRKRDLYGPEKFFMAMFMVVNVVLLIWFYCQYDYISQRHLLPLMALTTMYIPDGLRYVSAKIGKPSWFSILLVIGLCICMPKLFGPSHYDKKNYRMAAEWLKMHTNKEDVVAVPDLRISFYAERSGLIYSADDSVSGAKYMVRPVTKQIMETKNGLDKKIAFCDINIVGHPEVKRVIRELFLEDFQKGSSQTVSLDFSVPPGEPPCEFRVYVFGENDLTLEAVDVWSVDKSTSKPIRKEYTITDRTYPMATLVGTEDTVSRHIRASTEGFLAYGPYIPLKKGDYSVEFQIRLNNPDREIKPPAGMCPVWASRINKKGKMLTIYAAHEY